MVSIKKPRCQLNWSQQAGCQYAKGDNYPHSECLAPLDNDCRLQNTKWTSAVWDAEGEWQKQHLLEMLNR